MMERTARSREEVRAHMAKKKAAKKKKK